MVLALIEVRLLPLPVPTLYRSVPQDWWERYGPTRGALAYGGVLGMGITTFIPLMSFHLILVAAVLLGAASGGLFGAAYGFGRALPVLLASFAIIKGVDVGWIGRWMVGSGLGRRLLRWGYALLLLTLAGSILTI